MIIFTGFGNYMCNAKSPIIIETFLNFNARLSPLRRLRSKTDQYWPKTYEVWSKHLESSEQSENNFLPLGYFYRRFQPVNRYRAELAASGQSFFQAKILSRQKHTSACFKLSIDSNWCRRYIADHYINTEQISDSH